MNGLSLLNGSLQLQCSEKSMGLGDKNGNEHSRDTVVIQTKHYVGVCENSEDSLGFRYI